MHSSLLRGSEKHTSKAEVSDEKLWIVLRRAQHAITECLENGVISRGIAVAEFIVLEVLLHSEALTTSGICRKTRMAAASVEITIARLQEQEQISLQPGQREKAFHLSEQGRRSIEWLYGEHLKDITQAQTLLKDGAVPISDIASATGFGDQSHLSRRFQNVIGVSVRAWQRDHHLR
jgi:AraC-like DNA-binding protein